MSIPSSLEVTDTSSGIIAVAERVKLSDIEAAIQHEFYVNGLEALECRMVEPLAVGAAPVSQDTSERLRILTICMLVLKNGFMVIGKAAPASPANYNAEYGRQLAYEDAVRQVWPLMGHELCSKLLAAAEKKRDTPYAK